MRTSEVFQQLQRQLEQGQFVRGETFTSSEIAELREQLQIDMLRETISYAAEHVPYYAELWKDQGVPPDSIQSIDDLRQLPILRKADVVHNRHRMLSSVVRVASYRCTSGTTGLRMPLPISREEVDAIDQFGALRALASGVAEVEPMVLRIVPPVRRLAAESVNTGRGPVLTTFLNLDAADHRFDFDYYDHIIQCLVERFPVTRGSGRVDVLWACPPFIVRTLTDGLLWRSFDPKTTMVRNVVSSGGVITQALCNYVSDHWDARLNGFYSLTEVAGAHARCSLTGAYHFDLFAIPEILKQDTLQPVEANEEGVLVLTSLLPFQQAQPMIRYWTGDVFTLKVGECACGFNGMSGVFRGRQSQCLDLSSVLPPQARPRLLGVADILEVLERFPELPHFHKNPRFHISLEKRASRDPQLALVIESYPLPSSAEARLVDNIKRGLSQIISWADAPQPDNDFFTVRLVRKGELRSVVDFYPDR